MNIKVYGIQEERIFPFTLIREGNEYKGRVILTYTESNDPLEGENVEYCEFDNEDLFERDDEYDELKDKIIETVKKSKWNKPLKSEV